MTAVFLNDIHRLLRDKGRIVLTVVLIAAAILMAVFFTSQSEIRGNIAYISQTEPKAISSPYLRITYLKQAPPFSALVSDQYDAFVFERTDGRYDLQTIKNDQEKQMILSILEHPKTYVPNASDLRGIGTNIVGFLMMFLLLEGVVLMYMFAEDKEKRQIVRVAAAPLPFTRYLLAHGLFTFCFLLLPTLAVLYVIKWILRVEIGFHFPEYLLLLAAVCAVSTAFSLFLHAMSEKSDTANMIGSLIAMLTSILAGSFYSFEKGNAALETIIQILPQKALLNAADALERGAAAGRIIPPFLYVLLITAALFVFAVIKTRRDYVGRN